MKQLSPVVRFVVLAAMCCQASAQGVATPEITDKEIKIGQKCVTGTEVTVVRIYLSEAHRGRKKTLVQEVLNVLHQQHKLRGVTVFRGIAGIGDTGEVHASDMLRIRVDLPVVIEFFDTPEVVAAIRGLLSPIIPAGRTISWSATCQ